MLPKSWENCILVNAQTISSRFKLRADFRQFEVLNAIAVITEPLMVVDGIVFL
jgi:hypothetical protein